MKYLFKIGTLETYVYNDFTRLLSDYYNGTLTKEQIHNAINILQKEDPIQYYHEIDSLSLLGYFLDKENVDIATVIEKTKAF